VPPLLPGTRCALAAPFRPCPRDRPAHAGRSCTGGLFSVALSLGSPPPAVNRHRFPVEPGLSSTDKFAPPAAAVRLSGAAGCARPRSGGQASGENPSRCGISRGDDRSALIPSRDDTDPLSAPPRHADDGRHPRLCRNQRHGSGGCARHDGADGSIPRMVGMTCFAMRRRTPATATLCDNQQPSTAAPARSFVRFVASWWFFAASQPAVRCQPGSPLKQPVGRTPLGA